MRYTVLASDYDGDLAKDGVVAPETLEALERLRTTGRLVVMVTGRELVDLGRVFGRFDLFDCIVAENGAVLYWPARYEKRVLAVPANPAFVAALELRGIQPLSVGDVVVATTRPNENSVLEVVRDFGLELQIVLNKGSVMLLPPSVDKLTGLNAVLTDWGVPLDEVVGVGDAENDESFLRECGYSVAVANALPSLKQFAQLTTRGHHGAGVVELIDKILVDDA